MPSSYKISNTPVNPSQAADAFNNYLVETRRFPQESTVHSPLHAPVSQLPAAARSRCTCLSASRESTGGPHTKRPSLLLGKSARHWAGPTCSEQPIATQAAQICPGNPCPGRHAAPLRAPQPGHRMRSAPHSTLRGVGG
jgi:hypothetical protein